MIRYTLLCATGHAFESWFRDSAAYDALAGSAQVSCPDCGSTEVRKALMAPSVVTSRKRAATAEPAPEAAPASAPAASTPPAHAPQPVALIDDRARHVRAMVRALHRRITQDADDVGRAFAAEARAIHDKTAPARSIYGEASRDEVRDLLEDGIPLMPMPTLPDEHH